MKKLIFAGFVLFLMLFPGKIFAQELLKDPVKFVANNPDGNKYVFMKHYIMSLKYFKDNEEIVGGLGHLTKDDLKNNALVRRQMDNLLRANANLRVARNIMSRYNKPDNMLMYQISENFAKVCDQQITINNEERELWNELINSVKEIALGLYDVSNFNDRYRILADERKGALNGLLETSILASTALISPKLNGYGHHGYLGVSKNERFKLINLIKEEFSGEMYEGELREGQTFLQASVVSIRAILENYRKETLDS